MKTVNWGILGTAAIATGKVMPAFKDSPSATLLALASRGPAKGRAAGQEFGVPRVYAGYDELLADPDVDVVYIPLPNQLHFEWSLRALEKGKHVLCEKPLCLTADHVSKLCAARDRAGLHIEEGFAFRNHPQWEKLEELLNTDAIGQIRAVHVALAKQFFDPSDIRNNPSAGGGGLYDLGSYTIAVCNMIFNAPAKRVVSAIERDPIFGTDRLTTALLDYGDRHATFTVATQAGPSSWGTHQQLTVIGAKGWLRFDFPCAHARSHACSIELGDAQTVGSFASTTFKFEPVNQYAREVERFSQLILGQKVATWPIEDSLLILRTIEALFESARTSTWQALPQ
jgi:predicted dehydrogenase